MRWQAALLEAATEPKLGFKPIAVNETINFGSGFTDIGSGHLLITLGSTSTAMPTVQAAGPLATDWKGSWQHGVSTLCWQPPSHWGEPGWAPNPNIWSVLRPHFWADDSYKAGGGGYRVLVGIGAGEEGETAKFRAVADAACSNDVISFEDARERVQKEKNKRAVALLRKWISDDGAQRDDAEALEILKKGLDQNRHSDRKLFP